jgi:hypothetical protein
LRKQWKWNYKKSKSSFSIDLILDDYLKLKNALTNDDSKLASEAGKDLQATLQKKRKLIKLKRITKTICKHC